MSPTPGTAAPAITAGGTTPLHNVSFADTLAQARHGEPANPAEQIAVQVQRAQVAGQDQISIKLHPAELGRIEVKLERSEEHMSELQSLMRISYAVFCLKKKI